MKCINCGTELKKIKLSSSQVKHGFFISSFQCPACNTWLKTDSSSNILRLFGIGLTVLPFFFDAINIIDIKDNIIGFTSALGILLFVLGIATIKIHTADHKE